ncbi:prenyltransferase/squalene oxidase repeat-containing protein [Actinosynnema sp. NPDC059797]
MIEAARTFLWHNARVLEQRRFAFLFDGGPAEPVVHAVLAHRNDDGGFGHALEPDGRGPTSQPLHTFTALSLLHEVGATDAGAGAIVSGALDFLASVANPDGGVPNCLATASEHPRAPWWQVSGDGDLLMTALLASTLHRIGAEHPWLDRATEFCWRGVDGLVKSHPYEAAACAHFLDAAPDRDRATAAAGRLGALVREQGLVDLGEGQAPEGYAAGETHKPHHYAPTPDHLARSWFTDEEVERDLDDLAAGQREDGGWTFPWPSWTPVTTYEWRPIVTIEALRTLRAYGRIS